MTQLYLHRCSGTAAGIQLQLHSRSYTAATAQLQRHFGVSEALQEMPLDSLLQQKVSDGSLCRLAQGLLSQHPPQQVIECLLKHKRG